MQRRVLSVALTFGMAAGTLTLSGCATTGARISQHPEIYQQSLADRPGIGQPGTDSTGYDHGRRMARMGST